jgi:hypothetical protein
MKALLGGLLLILFVAIIITVGSVIFFLFGTSYGACLRYCWDTTPDKVIINLFTGSDDPLLKSCSESPEQYRTDVVNKVCIPLSVAHYQSNNTAEQKK